MKTTIFVAITIAALGAVGVTTSIMSSGIPVHAQAGTQCPPTAPHGTVCTNGQQSQGSTPASGGGAGRTTITVGEGPFSASGNVAGSGGGHESGTTCGIAGGCPPTKCVGSLGFQAGC